MDEDGAAGIHRRAQLVQYAAAGDDVAEDGVHIGARDAQVGHALRRDLGAIGGQRHRRRAGVGIAGEAGEGALAAAIGQLVGQVGVGAAGAAARDFAQFFLAHERDDRIDHAGAQLQVRAQVGQAHLAALEQHFGQ